MAHVQRVPDPFNRRLVQGRRFADTVTLPDSPPYVVLRLKSKAPIPLQSRGPSPTLLSHQTSGTLTSRASTGHVGLHRAVTLPRRHLHLWACPSKVPILSLWKSLESRSLRLWFTTTSSIAPHLLFGLRERYAGPLALFPSPPTLLHASEFFN